MAIAFSISSKCGGKLSSCTHCARGRTPQAVGTCAALGLRSGSQRDLKGQISHTRLARCVPFIADWSPCLGVWHCFVACTCWRARRGSCGRRKAPALAGGTRGGTGKAVSTRRALSASSWSSCSLVVAVVASSALCARAAACLTCCFRVGSSGTFNAVC